jgi:endo-1,4-beta-xylanase
MKRNIFLKKQVNALLNFKSKNLLTLSTMSILLICSCSKEDGVLEQQTIENGKSKNPENSSRTGFLSSGFFYTIDAENQLGQINISKGNAGPGNFIMQWNNVRQVVGGIGWNSTQRRTINYNVGYIAPNDVKFVGVYGWTKSPLTEYYVCEQGPGAIFNGQVAGNDYSVNGRNYKMRKNFRNQKPSIDGTASFWQVEGRWGNYRTGTNNSVNVGQHIDNFRGALGRDFGLTLNGSNCYMVFGCEAYNYNNNGNNRISGSMNASIWSN